MSDGPSDPKVLETIVWVRGKSRVFTPEEVKNGAAERWIKEANRVDNAKWRG